MSKKKDSEKRCCSNCAHGDHPFQDKCKVLAKVPEYAELASDNCEPFSDSWDRELKRMEIRDKYCCQNYVHRWLTCPFPVEEMKVDKIEYNRKGWHEPALVKIRPCKKEYGDKTYLGILLGDLPIAITQSYDRKKKTLKTGVMSNPGIFVPELGKIIFGSESWWGVIKTAEELKEISDKDIDNVWYVKAMKELIK